jgi:hypothetical protein
MARWQQAIPLESETSPQALASNRWKSAIPVKTGNGGRPKPVEADPYALSLLKQHAKSNAPVGQTATDAIQQAQEEESRRRLTHPPRDPESEDSFPRRRLIDAEIDAMVEASVEANKLGLSQAERAKMIEAARSKAYELSQLTRSERLLDATTAIPKGIVKGVVGDILGIPGDLFDITKMASDKVRDWAPLPEWYKKVDKELGEIVEAPFKRIPGSEEIIEGLKDIGVPLDRPKTRAGRYIESYDRGAAGFLAGPFRWIKQLMKHGGLSGIAGEAGEELSGSPVGRTAAQIGTLLLTPRFKYSNAGMLLKENMEFLTRRELRDAHRLVKDSHRVKHPLLGPEALPRGPIQGLAADTMASPSGGQLIAALLKDRPEQVAKIKDKFISHFGVPPGTSVIPQVTHLFASTDPNTHEAIRTLATTAPALFRAGVVDYIERAYEGAAQSIQGGPSLYSGWAFKDLLVGTPQRRRNFEVMLEGLDPATRAEINTTLEVLGHSGKINEIGQTTGRGRIHEVATRDETPITWRDRKKFPLESEAVLLERAQLKELDRRSRKTNIDLAKAMGSQSAGLFPNLKRRLGFVPNGKRRYDPDTILNMIDLAAFSGINRLTAKKLGLLLTGLRYDNGWPVVDVATEDDGQEPIAAR